MEKDLPERERHPDKCKSLIHLICNQIGTTYIITCWPSKPNVFSCTFKVKTQRETTPRENIFPCQPGLSENRFPSKKQNPKKRLKTHNSHFEFRLIWFHHNPLSLSVFTSRVTAREKTDPVKRARVAKHPLEVRERGMNRGRNKPEHAKS